MNRRQLWTGLVVACCWLCGCSAPLAARAVSLEVVGTDELRFEPAELTAPAGVTINLTFRNQGNLQHSFALLPEAADINLFTINQENFPGEIDTGQIDGGASFRLAIDSLDPGSYTLDLDLGERHLAVLLPPLP